MYQPSPQRILYRVNVKIAVAASVATVAAVAAVAVGLIDRSTGGHPATSSGSSGVTISGAALLRDTSTAGYGYTPNAPCGAGDQATAASPAPLTFTVEIDGTLVYNGQTAQGTGTEDGQCSFAFQAPHVPRASFYNVIVGGQLTRVPSADASAVSVILNQ